jgi:hypothetical protein
MVDPTKRNGEPGSLPGSIGFRWALGICGALAVAALLMRVGDFDSSVLSKQTVHETRRPVENPRHGWFVVPPLGAELQTINADELALSEIPNALAILQQLNDDEAAKELCLRLIRRWADNNPAEAAAWATELPPGAVRAAALDQVAIAWANMKFEDAAAWARQLPDEAEKDRSLRSIAFEVARVEPFEAVRLATELPAGEARDGLVLHAAAEWASRDAEQAVEWSRQISDGPLREQVLAAVATAWADRNPADAAAMAMIELPSGRTRDDALISIAQRWAQQDPERAAAWVEKFFGGELRLVAIQNIETIWSQRRSLP